MCAALVQYLPIWRCRATLFVCGGEEDSFNMLLTCQDQLRPPAVRGRAPGTVRVTRVVLRLVRRAHSVEADAVKAAVKEVTPRVTLPRVKAGSEVQEQGSGSAAAKEKAKKQKEWATEVLEEFTFPIPETVNISNKILAAFRTLNPGSRAAPSRQS